MNPAASRTVGGPGFAHSVVQCSRHVHHFAGPSLPVATPIPARHSIGAASRRSLRWRSADVIYAQLWADTVEDVQDLLAARASLALLPVRKQPRCGSRRRAACRPRRSTSALTARCFRGRGWRLCGCWRQRYRDRRNRLRHAGMVDGSYFLKSSPKLRSDAMRGTSFTLLICLSLLDLGFLPRLLSPTCLLRHRRSPEPPRDLSLGGLVERRLQELMCCRNPSWRIPLLLSWRL